MFKVNGVIVKFFSNNGNNNGGDEKFVFKIFFIKCKVNGEFKMKKGFVKKVKFEFSSFVCFEILVKIEIKEEEDE